MLFKELRARIARERLNRQIETDKHSGMFEKAASWVETNFGMSVVDAVAAGRYPIGGPVGYMDSRTMQIIFIPPEGTNRTSQYISRTFPMDINHLVVLDHSGTEIGEAATQFVESELAGAILRQVFWHNLSLNV